MSTGRPLALARPNGRLRQSATFLHGAEVAVFGAFVLAAFLLPTGIDVPILDDGVYAWMAERFAAGSLEIHPLAAASAVLEAVLGGALLDLFGGGIGTLRWASVALTFVGGVAMAVAATALGITGWRRALVAGSFLFNPIGFALSYSFMTDSHVVALEAIAVACWLWGLRAALRLPLLAAGSAVAAIACMSRAPALALAAGAATTIVLDRRLRAQGSRAVAALAIVTVPSVVAAGGGQAWLASQPTAGQDRFVSALTDLPLRDLVVFVERVVTLHAVYVVGMLLPLCVAVAALAHRSLRRISRPRAIALGASAVLGALALASLPGSLFPFTPSWFTVWGLGSWDLNGLPAGILTTPMRTALTVAIFGVLALVGLVAFDRWPRFRDLEPGEILCACLLVSIALFAVPASAGFVPVVTLDRYLLPAAVPAALLLGRALRDRRLTPVLPFAVLGVVAAFSVTATYDELSFHRAIARLDARAAAAGAEPAHIDAGPGLSGYRSLDMPATPAADNPRPTWWTVAFAPAVTGEWIIAAGPAPGYEVIAIESYPTILQTKSTALYLLRRT